MPIFLQPVELPERCFLHEVLLWVAFQRLPIAAFTLNGTEIREEYEVAGYSVEVGESFLMEEETRRLGIPTDPEWLALLEDTPTLPASYYNDLLRRNDLEEELRQTLELQRQHRFATEHETWRQQ